MRYVVFLLALTASVSAAQPLTVTPNPFDASGAALLVVRNDTAVPVRFDSLTFGRAQPRSAVGWFLTYTIDPPEGPSGGVLS